jgi:hypothetical protein
MKKLLLATFIATALFNTANAQTERTPAPATSSMTKAEKEAAKAKKEANLAEAFTKAGLTAEEQEKCRVVLTESNEKTKPIKADASLTEDAKKEKLETIYKQRNDDLKAIMGEDRYKIFKETQKAQKQAAEPAKAGK